MMAVFLALRDCWDRLEALIGLIAVFVIAFAPVTISGGTLLLAVLMGEWQVAQIAGPVFAITCPLACWLAKMSEPAFWEFVYHDEERVGRTSFAQMLAAKVPPLPAYLRVPLALWWFIHFVAGMALVELSPWLDQQGILLPMPAEGIPSVIFGYLFHFACNVFLILAAATLIRSKEVTNRIWRRRFLYDVIFTIPLILKLLL